MDEEKTGPGSSIAPKLRWKTAEKFFPIVVDDFFDNPEEFVKLGKSLPKKIMGRQMGIRSQQFGEIDEDLHNAILKKILSCHYDLDYVSLTWEASNICFHEIPRFSENKNDIRNKGWIHQDGKVTIAGLIYLNPDIDPDSGTSLWTLKPNVQMKMAAGTYYDLTKQSWRLDEDGSLTDGEEYVKVWTEQRKNFEEKLRFQNIFNRMILYDSMEWHGANSYYHEDGKDPRLTLAFFIVGIESDVGYGGPRSDWPLNRVKSYDSIINEKIKSCIYSNVR
jgi:hypothetical protein